MERNCVIKTLNTINNISFSCMVHLAGFSSRLGLSIALTRVTQPEPDHDSHHSSNSHYLQRQINGSPTFITHSKVKALNHKTIKLYPLVESVTEH